MLTIFVEPEAADADIALMRTHADVVRATRPATGVMNGKVEESSSV
jgi:hypothetical protein